MLNSDIEKGAGATNHQRSNIAQTENHHSFLPTYEEHVNLNLRNFGVPETQVGIEKFDHIHDAPQCGRRGWLKREYIIFAIVLLIIFALALPLGLIYMLRGSDSGQKTVTMQTREVASIPSRASLTSSVVPSTIYVTVTPTASIEIPIVTLTTTLPTPKVSLTTITPEAKTKTENVAGTKETAQQTSTVTNTRTITESPVPTDTVTSMSTVNLSTTAEMSQETVPHTTTVLSVLTVPPTTTATTHPWITVIPVTPDPISSTSTSSIRSIQGDPFRLLCGAPGAACP